MGGQKAVPTTTFFGTQPYMGGCQNYGAFLGTLNIRCRIIIGIQNGTVILTTTYMSYSLKTLVSPLTLPAIVPIYNPLYHPIEGVSTIGDRTSIHPKP